MPYQQTTEIIFFRKPLEVLSQHNTFDIPAVDKNQNLVINADYFSEEFKQNSPKPSLIPSPEIVPNKTEN